MITKDEINRLLDQAGIEADDWQLEVLAIILNTKDRIWLGFQR